MSPPPSPPPLPSPQHNLPGKPATQRNKRARPPISCLECRRKKLKCDRVQPCMQCKKGGRDALCTFANGPSGPSPRATDEEQKIKRPRLDHETPTLGYGNTTSWAASDRASVTPACETRHLQGLDRGPDASLGCIYVKGGTSRYLGMEDKMSMLGHFEEAKSFMMSTCKHADSKHLLIEMGIFQKLSHRKHKIPPLAYPSQDRAGLIMEMLRSLPKAFCSIVIQFCFAYQESLTRVFHVPSFTRECAEAFRLMMATPGTLPPNVRESLLPQVLATLALSLRSATRSKILELNGISEESVGGYIGLVQQWVDGLGGKDRLSIHSLQTQTLLLLIHQNNNALPIALWKESGNLVRSAMVMGLHQDPEECSELSLFEKEHRRKLWRTIIELDIQCSISINMPTALRSSDFKLRDLRNVDDSDLALEMGEYPEDKGHNTWTDSIVQIALGSTLTERLDATNLIGGHLNLDRDAPFLLQQAVDLEKSIQTLPLPVRSDVELASAGDNAPRKLFSKVMLDVFLRRPSLSIYRAIALSPQRSSYPEARKGAIRCSIALLSHLDALDPAVADLNIIKDRDLLDLFHVLCRNDIIVSALFLCWEIHNFGQSTANSANNPLEDVAWTKHSLTRIVENTLNSLIQRLGEFGSDLKDVLPVSIVLQSVRSAGTGEEKSALMQKGADRVLNACRAVLPEIEEMALAKENENSTMQPTPQMLPARCNGQGTGYSDSTPPGPDASLHAPSAELNDWDIDQSWL